MSLPRLKKILPILTILTLAGFGCSGLSATQKAAVQPITLNYWTIANDVGQLNKFASAYHKLRPYVTINVRQVRYSEFDSLLVNSLADDVPPNIVSVHARWMRKYQNRLTPMPASVKVATITVSGSYSPETTITVDQVTMPTLSGVKANFVGTVVNDAVMDGTLYGLPLALDTLAIYYNKDLLDKAGIPLPPKNWNEFLDAVKKSTKFSKEGDIIQSGVALGTGKNIDHVFDIMSLFMMQNGVTIARGNAVVFAPPADTSEVAGLSIIQALRFYTDFADSTKEVYTWNDGLGSSFDAFTRGKSVFYIGFASDLPRIQGAAPQMNLDVIPMPQLRGETPTNITSYWIESVIKKSKHQDEAWDFIRFMATSENLKQYSTATHQPSPLRTHIVTQMNDPLLAPFAGQILQAANWYHGRNVDVASQAFVDMIDAYRKPYLDAEEPNNRDLRILRQTAAVVQQTM